MCVLSFPTSLVTPREVALESSIEGTPCSLRGISGFCVAMQGCERPGSGFLRRVALPLQKGEESKEVDEKGSCAVVRPSQRETVQARRESRCPQR
jgi:hypothetical protein